MTERSTLQAPKCGRDDLLGPHAAQSRHWPPLAADGSIARSRGKRPSRRLISVAAVHSLVPTDAIAAQLAPTEPGQQDTSRVDLMMALKLEIRPGAIDVPADLDVHVVLDNSFARKLQRSSAGDRGPAVRPALHPAQLVLAELAGPAGTGADSAN